MRKYFGTDGVRGIVDKELTYDLALKLGRAGGYVLGKDKEKVTVIIGKDTRVSGDKLESALSLGLTSVGCNVISVGVIPTPGVAYLIKKYNADCGVVISASHNPYEYNGIKFFNSEGYKLDDSIESEIEKFIDNPNLIDISNRKLEGKNINVVNENKEPRNALDDYAFYLKSSVCTNFRGMKIVLDCSQGASFEVAPKIFKDLGADVIVINNTPTGVNINENCGSTHPESLQKEVVKNNADLGLAYDGDADRLIAVDEKGNIVDGDKIMILSAIYLKNKSKLKNNTLVTTVMSNIGLNICAKEHGINIVSTSVGDRYVLEEMLKSGYNLGGEQSGHMIFLDHNTTGDGILSSLMLSKIVKEEGKKLSELASIMKDYPQVLVNAKVKNENKNKYIEVEEISNKIKHIEDKLNGKGRVLIRPSGTEPLVRVMLEGENREELNLLATDLAKLIEEKLN